MFETLRSNSIELFAFAAASIRQTVDQGGNITCEGSIETTVSASAPPDRR